MNKDSKSFIDLANINKKVYEFIKKQIIHLTYPPGHKINVRELQRELGISQTPIKNALFRLAGEGMVEISAQLLELEESWARTRIFERGSRS